MTGSNETVENETISPVENETVIPIGVDLKGTQIQQRLKRNDGIYVEGEVEDVKVAFTSDTGATRSLISPQIYNCIQKQQRSTLRKSVGLSGESGLLLKQYSCSDFGIKPGNLELNHEFIVAEVEDEGLIGMDKLLQGSDGLADILLNEVKIRLHGVSIPCISAGLPKKVRKVRVAEKLIIEGNSEMAVDAFIERQEEEDYRNKPIVLIEPVVNFAVRHRLLKAAQSSRHKTQHQSQSTITEYISRISRNVLKCYYRIC